MPPLREVRVRKLLTIRKLAARADVATRTITELEAGRAVPHFETMRRLAAALEIEPTEVDEFRAAVERALARQRSAGDGEDGETRKPAVSPLSSMNEKGS